MYRFDEKKKISSLFVHYIASFRPKKNSTKSLKIDCSFFFSLFFQESGGSFEFRVAPSELIIDPLNTPWMEGWKARGSLSYVSLIPTPGIANWHACACNRCAGRANPVRKYLELSLSLLHPQRARGGRGRPLLCPAFGETRNRKSSSRMDCFPFFFFCRYSLSLFFFRLPFQRLSSSSSGKN